MSTARDPLIRVLERLEATDQRIAGTGPARPAPRTSGSGTLQSEDRDIGSINFCRYMNVSRSIPRIRARDDRDRLPHLPVGKLLRGGQAIQGTRWMPWRQKPMKDVAGNEMPRGAASKL